MKISAFTCFLFFVFTVGYSQKNNPSLDLSQIRTDLMVLKQPENKTLVNGHLYNLVIVDARADTTSLGFYITSSGRPYSLSTTKNLSDEVKEFLGAILGVADSRDSSGEKILVVLRKLWLTPELPEDLRKVDLRNEKARGGVMIKIDFYIEIENKYRPLYRFDTLCPGLKNIKREAPAFLGKALTMSVEPLLSYDLPKKTTAESDLSLDDILVYSRSAFDKPITHATSYKKGVYQSFDEFRMNNPSIEDYTLTKDKLTQTIFFKDARGRESAQRDLWGYCDGKHLYIKSGDNYFELKKKQHTFISMAARPLRAIRSVKTGNVMLFGPVWGSVGQQNKKVSYDLKYRIYELDMDSGELY